MQKKPDPGRIGLRVKIALLVGAVAVRLSRTRRKALPITEIHDVLKFRSSWRQVRRVQEVSIEGEITRRSAVYQRAAFERSSRVF